MSDKLKEGRYQSLFFNILTCILCEHKRRRIYGFYA